MNPVKQILLALLLFLPLGSHAQQRPWLNKRLPIAQRVNALLDQMTVEEMISQLNLLDYNATKDSTFRVLLSQGKVGATFKSNGARHNRDLQRAAIKGSRLGIPLMFHEDVIHGYRTVSPIPVAEACSWDTALVRRSAEVAAREAAAAGLQLTYAPMVDISTDPRWGRVLETSGEDPFLSSAMATARIRGFQGDDLSAPTTVMACIKHFLGYASITGGIDYRGEDFSRRRLEERFLPPYIAGVKAGVGSLMCSYTHYNGIPACFDPYLGHQLLRQQLGFKGLYMTDYETGKNALRQGASPSLKLSAEKMARAGIDMDMQSRSYARHLLTLYREGKVSRALIRDAAYRCLEAKFKVGLFDDPYRYFDEKREKAELSSAKNRNEVLDMAVESMVLLKNDQQTLPLTGQKRIAVVGPYAELRKELLGTWTAKGRPEEVINVAEGMRNVFGNDRITVAACPFEFNVDSIDAVLKTAQEADAVDVCIGESLKHVGEGGAMATLNVPESHLQLLKRLRTLGKKTIVVMFGGRPLCTQAVLNQCDALLFAWFPGTMGGQAVAQLLSGKSIPSGKLCQTFPRSAAQIPIYYNEYRRFGIVKYGDMEMTPQFPFGFGLSYNHYAYSALQLSASKAKTTDGVNVSVKVKNNGQQTGREVVQLYVRHVYDASAVIPKEKELKGFRSIILAPGEEQTVTFSLTPEAFQTLGEDMQWRTYPGRYEIQVGPNSADVLTQQVTLE